MVGVCFISSFQSSLVTCAFLRRRRMSLKPHLIWVTASLTHHLCEGECFAGKLFFERSEQESVVFRGRSITGGS